MEEKRKLVRPNNLIEKFVMVDGIGRTAKSMMGVIIASMKRVEKERIDAIFDYIPRLHEMGKLSHDAAITMLKLEADYLLYYNMISRDVNFRPSDYSSVFKDPYPKRYVERLFLEEGPPAVERIMKEKPIFQNMTHSRLANADLFFDAFGDKIKFLHMLRNPTDIIYDWYCKGFGTRIGTDPREFQFTFEWKGDVVPILSLGWEDEYMKVSPMDRTIRMVDMAYRGNIKGYNKLSEENKKKVFFIIFEKFVVDPIPYTKKIANFIGTELTPATESVLIRERCPRVLNPEDRKEARRVIEKEASKEYIEILDNLEKDFENFCENVVFKKNNLGNKETIDTRKK